jgi:hypothetical protein
MISMIRASAARPTDKYTSASAPEIAPAISSPIATATTDTIAPNRITGGLHPPARCRLF